MTGRIARALNTLSSAASAFESFIGLNNHGVVEPKQVMVMEEEFRVQPD